jgi:hypothetical protein
MSATGRGIRRSDSPKRAGVGAWLLAAVLAGCAPSVAGPDRGDRSLPDDAEALDATVSANAVERPAADTAPALPPDRPSGQGPNDDRLLDKTFDDLKFDIEPDGDFERSLLTSEIEALAGRRVRIRGYILPSFQKRLREFVLVRDNQECCFGPGAALYDCILVEMAPGKVAEFSVRPVTVEGRFSIEEFIDPFEEKVRAIYRLRGESVD